MINHICTYYIIVTVKIEKQTSRKITVKYTRLWDTLYPDIERKLLYTHMHWDRRDFRDSVRTELKYSDQEGKHAYICQPGPYLGACRVCSTQWPSTARGPWLTTMNVFLKAIYFDSSIPLWTQMHSLSKIKLGTPD